MNEIFKFIKSDYFLLSSEDEFLSEYSHEAFKRLEFVTKFTGSYGFAVLAKNGNNKLFVDSRYTLQAKLEAKNFEVLKIEDLKPYLKGLEAKIAIDPNTVRYNFKIEGIEFEMLEENPIDKIWQRKTDTKCNVFDFKLAGETKEEKLLKVLDYLKQEACDSLFVFDPHDVCWLFNIRSDYLKNTPIIGSFAIVCNNDCKVKGEREFSIEDKGKAVLLSFKELSKLKIGKLLVPNFISLGCYNALKKACEEVVFEKEDFLLNQRVVKTESEIEAIRKAHAEDAKALKKFEKWLKTADLKKETEFTVGEKLVEFRKSVRGFVCESFPAIVGFKENGAIVHYHAQEQNAKKLDGKGLLLVDSGGQYMEEKLGICGTTDVTRVFAIGGEPSVEEKRVYTLALKGNIALSNAIFPEGTTGAMLDVLARQFLYQNGLNYGHGTGHGVGYFLSVHEGSFAISAKNNIPLKAGMIISNEPGCYLEGKFGIRFETLMLIKKHSAFEGFLCFETLTKFPVEMSLLDYEILTDSEIEFLKSIVA